MQASSRKPNVLFEYEPAYRATNENSFVKPPNLSSASYTQSWREIAMSHLPQFQFNPERLQNRTSPENPIDARFYTLVTEVHGDVLIEMQDRILELSYDEHRIRRRNNYHRDPPPQFANRRYNPRMYEKLPGPLPATVCRTNLHEKIAREHYWVTEKSDGIRYMLYLSKSNVRIEDDGIDVGVYFIDRKFRIFSINHTFYRNMLTTAEGQTLVDGELILYEDGLMFLPFDCLVYRGHQCRSDFLSTRLGYLKKFQAGFDNKTRDPLYASENLPVLFQIKEMVHAREIVHILSRITPTDVPGEFLYADERRTSRNDGLVFTPEEMDYHMKGMPNQLLKWKPLEKNTVDLKLKRPFIFRGELELYAGGPKGIDVPIARIHVTPEVRAKFEELLREAKNASDGFVESFITECAYDPETQEWCLGENRLDKSRANFISVCTETVRVMMDNVETRELQAVCEACRPF